MVLRGARDCAGLRVSFRKCDIFWEQTVEVMCDHSPRGKSFLQIVSRVERNGDSSSWPFSHSGIIPSCLLIKSSRKDVCCSAVEDNTLELQYLPGELKS